MVHKGGHERVKGRIHIGTRKRNDLFQTIEGKNCRKLLWAAADSVTTI